MFFLKYTEIPKSICKGRKKQLQASSMQEGKKAFKENIPDTDKQLQEEGKKNKKKTKHNNNHNNSEKQKQKTNRMWLCTREIRK